MVWTLLIVALSFAHESCMFASEKPTLTEPIVVSLPDEKVKR